MFLLLLFLRSLQSFDTMTVDAQYSTFGNDVLLFPRFPHIKAKAHSGTEPGVKVETAQMEIPEATVKSKGKVHKFGIDQLSQVQTHKVWIS